MTAVKDIRSEFLGYFAKQGHTVVDSSPLVPQNDPTMMFVNSGMVQFKNIFTGAETRDYTRATTAQKCVRAGGKHNDLENVGYTARHHTFFEMLGNFSFGDYFKDDAIAYAWELVTKNFGLPKDKLLVTVYHDDDQAANIWKKVAGLSDNRIIRIPTSDNFWSMGDTGPCGPCSEIFFDHGEDIYGGPPGSAEEDGDRFIEIWNLVFMQFEQVDANTRVPLPKPSIDTGMGLERVAAILQGKHNNYDIDLMRAIIEHSADLTRVSADGAQCASHRVIADHLRSAAFLLADGVMPSNDGRGYVLRRIMRRGMRHAHLLGAQDPLLCRLVPTLIAQMGEAYPELKRAESLIVETLKLEETRFKKTLDRGLRLLDDEAGNIGEGGTLSGDVAFRLYDTYGFPVDLTADALKARKVNVDMDGFNVAMEKARDEARKSWAGSGDAGMEKIWFEVERTCGSTEFLGYEKDTAEAQIKAIVKDGAIVKELKQGEEGFVVVNQTPFYAESGGQVGDHGIMTSAEGLQAVVADVQKKLGGVFAHRVTASKGTIKTGDAVSLTIDLKRRNATRAHHSATHLLHEALRQRLGDHVAQKGSLVSPDRLRFDISQPTPIKPEDIAIVEAKVNEEIRANSPVETRILPLEEAVESGARALFGEKYDNEVRVVSMGSLSTNKNGKAQAYSVELCGGTHVKRTGDIGAFVFTGESAVSAGVRRIEGLTGDAALAYMKARSEALEETAQILKVPTDGVSARVQSLLDEKRKLEKELGDLRRKMATGGASSSSAPDIKEFGGVKFTARVLQDIPAKDLKPMADDLKAKLGSGVITLIAVNEGKASIVVGVTADLTDRISAVDLVKAGAEVMGGQGGGGRPDMAQAGGPNGDSANDAVSKIESLLAS